MSIKDLAAAAMLLGVGACSPSGTPNVDAQGGGVAPPFTTGVSTLAGWAAPGDVDGSRDVALFANPVNVIYGPDGNVYVADFDNGKIRVIDAAGNTSTVIDQANFLKPFAMVFAPNGALYVTTDDNTQGHSDMSGTVWEVDIHAKTAKIVIESIGRPRGIVVLASGKLALSDYEHHVVELLDPATGILTPLAGTWDAAGFADGLGPAARFSTPYGMVLKGGALVMADYDNNCVRSVGLDGTVTTLTGATDAGFTDGAMTDARFSHPQGVTMDTAGDLFVTDVGNNRVRRIRGTTVDTVAGDGTAGYLDSNDPLQAELFGLEGLSVKPDGSLLFIADGGRGEDVPHNYIRQAQLH